MITASKKYVVYRYMFRPKDTGQLSFLNIDVLCARLYPVLECEEAGVARQQVHSSQHTEML